MYTFYTWQRDIAIQFVACEICAPCLNRASWLSTLYIVIFTEGETKMFIHYNEIHYFN